MLNRLRGRIERRLSAVSFCDSCASACDGRCRARSLRQAQRDRALAATLRR
jgi:hypothetical protein